MIKSMTGFGKQIINSEGYSVVVEIRTLNSKQLDLSTRICSLFREKESEIRAILTQHLERGKIDFSLYLENKDKQNTTINSELAKSYYQILVSLSEELGNPVTPELFTHALKMPDVVTTIKEEVSSSLWASVKKGIEEACHKVNEFRLSEGEHLAEDLKKRTLEIDKKMEDITPFEQNRIIHIRKKLEASLANLAQSIKYDQNRLEEEMIYFLEKLDITEEKTRLRKHCAYFLETMEKEEANGKKLSFIVQEFGREINTIGSKANDFNIQQIVVEMKDEVEKIKEQLANIL